MFRPICSRIIESEKPQGTNFKAAQGIVTVTVQAIGSFFWDLRGR